MENKFKRMVMSFFDEHDLKYHEVDERAIRISYDGDDIRDYSLFIITENDAKKENINRVVFLSSPIATFEGDLIAKGLILANSLNYSYRWVKFVINDNNDLINRFDAIVDEETAGEEIARLCNLAISVADDAFPDIMKARFA